VNDYPAIAYDEPEAFEPEAFEPEAFEPEAFEPEAFEPEAFEPEETSIEVKETEDVKEKVEVPEDASECSHHLGYLSEKSSKDQIPDECMMCKEIVTCMLKKMNA